jgi:GAF domain-containing protein
VTRVRRGGGGRPVDGGLDFPTVARLELDELLDQLIVRAGEVKTVQGRLRGLLAATRAVAEGVELEELLGRVVESARILVGARYGALGVVRDGRLVRFVHRGMSDEQVRAIGVLPAGKGVLGALVGDPRPRRLADLTADPDAVGFPPEHPGMRSFLGVPVQVGGAVYGNLYLTECEHADEFGTDDEQLVIAFAAASGVAIENALLLDAARRRERWQAAAARLDTELIAELVDAGDAESTDAALRRLLDTVLAVGRADGAALTVVDPATPEVAEVLVAVGALADWAGRCIDTPGSITQAAVDAHGPVLISDVASDPRTPGAADRVPGIGGSLAVSLSGDTDRDGDAPSRVLVLTRARNAGEFDAIDVEMVEAFATHAATATALLRGRRAREEIRRLDDRERLGRELQDHIVQRAQRTALALTSIASTADDPVRSRILAQVDDLDAMTRDVRETILPR